MAVWTTKEMSTSLNNWWVAKGACFRVIGCITGTEITKREPIMEKFNVELSAGENGLDGTAMGCPVDRLEGFK